MTNYEKACYIAGRLQAIFPTNMTVYYLSPEDILAKCENNTAVLNFYCDAVKKERCYE